MATAPEPVFPNGYENSNRYKLDQFVSAFLGYFCREPESTMRAQSIHWTPENIRWLKQYSMEEHLRWLNLAEESDEEIKRLVHEKNEVRPTPHAKQDTNEPQKRCGISKVQFCEEIYHVRGFHKQQMDENYRQCSSQNNVFLKDTQHEHCPGASSRRRDDSQAMFCQWDKLQEPKCVGAVAVVLFPRDKMIMHFAHNQDSCKWKKHSVDFQHAEKRLLEELKELLDCTVQEVVDVCIYMTYQPCHKSTDGLPNDSCCDYIIKYLKQCKIRLRFKTAFLHKAHWNPSKYYHPKQVSGIPETREQIHNAREGLSNLTQHNVEISAMNKDDWENLWRFVVDHH